MPSALRSLVAAGVVTALTVGGGLFLASPDDDAPAADGPTATPAPAPPASTPLADYDTRLVAVQRMPFCDLVAPTAVEAVLGTAPTTQTDYVNGDNAAVTRRVTDIAHEYACGWSAGDTAARAWVFAPPVTRGRAQDLVADAAGDDACTRIAGAAAFGRPSVGVVCRTDAGLRTSYRGLFGDAWLACSVQGTLPRDEAVEAAGAFCVAVAQAASTPSSPGS